MTDHPDDPVVQRKRLAEDLRAIRQDVGETQRQVADAMEWSVSKLLRVERSEVKITKNDLEALLRHYKVDDQRRVDELVEMARVSREDREESWSRFRDVHSDPYIMYLGFESSAWTIRNYHTLLLSSLLQVEEYHLAVQTEIFKASREKAERRWEGRQLRQKLHTRPQPPKMEFILDEGVIRRPIGSPGIMRRQLEELKRVAGLGHVDLRVVPYSAGAYPGLAGHFVLLEFQRKSDTDLLYLEQATDMVTRDDPGLYDQYLGRFFEIGEGMALSPEESIGLIDDAIRDMSARSDQHLQDVASAASS